MPQNIKNTFEKGTRSPDGKPGKNYWQNHARYNINITALLPTKPSQIRKKFLKNYNAHNIFQKHFIKL